HNIGLVFEWQAAHAPTSPALVCGDEVLDFRSLNELANASARWLVAQGVHRGQVVCVELPKMLEAYALALACIKLGAPYAFMDPVGPLDRIRRMMERCQPALVVSVRGGDYRRIVLPTDHSSRKLFREQFGGYD